MSLADSSRLQVGDFVVAIGNPFGLGQTVTSGIISALGRTGLGIEGYEDFIQTDASINPGNSGGALVNLRGELIGINTAILAPGGGNVGIGFAIPINMARDIMTQLVESGKVRRGRLGLQAQDLTPELAQAFGLPLTDKNQQGAVIAQVTPGSPAAQAGLKPGDIVTAVNGQAVRDSGTFRNAIGLLRVGKQVKLDILRDGRTQTVAVDIVEPPVAQSDNTPEDARLAGVLFGIVDERSELFGKLEGIPVVEVQPGSRAAEAGLRPGDIVTAVNRKPVRTSQDLANAVERSKGSLLLSIRRGQAALFIVIK
ncbi:MAG: PDZ domain-containing protein [Gammaproteobacteria bacterium]|nr:PDZ domain-containing protein [Gammaproteobacteria bacterium]